MSPASDLAIRTRGLRKVFGGKVAVRSLTLEVARGEVFGFLGPNGAGKSTSVKMLLGLVFPTSGKAEILGRPAGDVKTRSKVGFLPEHFRFYDWLTPAELLKLHGRLYGMSHTVLRERVPALLGLVGLTPHRNKRLRDFSKGMLQRIGLAQALLNEPDLIFLDEPRRASIPSAAVWCATSLKRSAIAAQPCCSTPIFSERSRSLATGLLLSGMAKWWRPANWMVSAKNKPRCRFGRST